MKRMGRQCIGLSGLLLSASATAQGEPAQPNLNAQLAQAEPSADPEQPQASPGTTPGTLEQQAEIARSEPATVESLSRGRGEYRFHRNEISVGTGVMAYFAGASPGTSGAWDVRYGFSPTRIFTIEGGYLGAAGGYGGGGPGGATVATVVEGDVQVKPLGGTIVNPFLLAGAGWGSFATSDNGPSDNTTVVVPMGVGAELRLTDRFVADGRFTYRLTAADSLGPQQSGLDSWAAIARVGAQF